MYHTAMMYNSSCRLTFPGIFIFYQMLSAVVHIAVYLTSFVFFKSLMCGSRNLLESLLPGNETPMCVITGNMQTTQVKHTAIYMSCSCNMDIHQPPGSSLVDFSPLNGLLCSLLAIQVSILEGVGLLQVHTHRDSGCRNSPAHYTSHNMFQAGGICNILDSTRLCSKEYSSIILFLCTSSDSSCGYRTLHGHTYTLEILF